MFEALGILFFIAVMAITLFIGILIGVAKRNKEIANYFNEIQKIIEREKWPF